jgi:hypothetical protein
LTEDVVKVEMKDAAEDEAAFEISVGFGSWRRM